MTYGSQEDELIGWEILCDQEYHCDTAVRPPNSANIILLSFNFQFFYSEYFFVHVFPSIVGNAKILENLLSDPRSFHDGDDDNPDWKETNYCFFLH